MAKRLTSVISLIALCALGNAQAFGRFGYNKDADVPGFHIDATGFSAKALGASRILFIQPSTQWQPVTTSDTEQDVLLTQYKGGPSKLKLDLLGVGFSLYFEKGIRLKVQTQGAPYLSWLDGSVAQNVSTPDVHWLVVSFRDRQPPIVLGFPNSPTSLIVTGKIGAWEIQSEDSFKGWVRVGLPDGLDPKLATTAGALGRLAKDAAMNSHLWTAMPPQLLKTSISEDLYSVTATWQFDSVGAVVPSAAMLAYLGGYKLDVRSPTVRLPGANELGPVDILKGAALTIRFPVRRVPTGRCLAWGDAVTDFQKTTEGRGIPGIVSLALHSLVSQRTAAVKKAAEDTLSAFISQTAYFLEPWTKQQLPFNATGAGIDTVAAQALLMQAITSSSRATSEANSLLTSVSWRQDWGTWSICATDPSVGLRASALAAVAGALCPESERRLAAGMLEAGLSAKHGLNVWKRRQGIIDQLPSLSEPVYGIRKGLFGLEGSPEPEEGFIQMLMSPLRIFSEPATALVKRGSDFSLDFTAGKSKVGVLMLASEYPISILPLKNIANAKLVSALGFSELHYQALAPGPCEIKLILPPYGKIPPMAVPVPAYSEVMR